MHHHETLMVLWILLSVGVGLFFQFNRNVQLKKRLLPVFIIGTGALFALFVLIDFGQPWILAFVIPGVSLISLLNLQIIKICDVCGRTVTTNVLFTKAEYCS